jgi:hypothetical protein|tara:strand:- start:1978 stop:2091 length:114 start_codon:yes stop_codon:yes gene_type:complete
MVKKCYQIDISKNGASRRNSLHIKIGMIFDEETREGF